MTFENFTTLIQHHDKKAPLSDYKAKWIAFKLLEEFYKNHLTTEMFNKLHSIIA